MPDHPRASEVNLQSGLFLLLHERAAIGTTWMHKPIPIPELKGAHPAFYNVAQGCTFTTDPTDAVQHRANQHDGDTQAGVNVKQLVSFETEHRSEL